MSSYTKPSPQGAKTQAKFLNWLPYCPIVYLIFSYYSSFYLLPSALWLIPITRSVTHTHRKYYKSRFGNRTGQLAAINKELLLLDSFCIFVGEPWVGNLLFFCASTRLQNVCFAMHQLPMVPLDGWSILLGIGILCPFSFGHIEGRCDMLNVGRVLKRGGVSPFVSFVCQSAFC